MARIIRRSAVAGSRETYTAAGPVAELGSRPCMMGTPYDREIAALAVGRNDFRDPGAPYTGEYGAGATRIVVTLLRSSLGDIVPRCE